MPLPLRLFAPVLLGTLLTATPLFAKPASARIAIRSVAAGYYAPPSVDGSDDPAQTFVLIDGGYAPGTARDGKLAKLTFAEVTAPLTAALIKRGFRPAAEGEAPMLHLVVEWGRTKPAMDMNMDISVSQIQEIHRDLPPSKRGNVDFRPDPQSESLRNALRMENAKLQLGADRRAYTTWDNALLLGYANELYALSQAPRAERPWKRHEELLNDLTSERLYLIVRAFAFETGADPADAPQAHLIWLTRLSIRDEGPNYPAQLELMLPFAARYFGYTTGELIRATSIKDLSQK
ncbi:hypothetical protein [Actomonas aquatica]|uniref:Uncharacterized protein n=1 Tax=Actomonas aquatica TaxID=2866162 RepID=A0ABZ1CA41_9BACT|nr:hypothetical protein [Opitutus sp. WL0086]WRQ88559.1 hypothetical protein K1X11_004030 [Opitutus sp. WL0086]